MRPVLVLALLVVGRLAAAGPLDPGVLGGAVGAPATATPEGGVRCLWPRSDVQVGRGGFRMAPAAGLTSWATIAPGEHAALLRSETVVFADEATPALDAALAHGLALTALDTPWRDADPTPSRLYLEGRGDALTLAGAVKAVWDAARAVRAAAPTPPARNGGRAARDGTPDVAPLSSALGVAVSVQDDVARFVVPRGVALHRTTAGESMGVATWGAFTGSDAAAAVDGDVAMTLAEVQATVRALRAGGLEVTALGNHLIGEQPPLWFVHFQGAGKAADLARALRATLDAQRAAGRR